MGDLHAAVATQVTPGASQEVLARVGQMTRALHENLRALGLDKLVERAASDIPDARDRLSYVARLSEDAAQRVLNATDAAMPLQESIGLDCEGLSAAWQDMLDSEMADFEWRALAERTIVSLSRSQAASVDTKGYLMDIMMAQDFQDLTGQVITRVTSIARELEQQLVQVLVDFAPPEVKREFDNGLLNGPQINPENNSDVVANQGQVDDLLDSLGF